MYKHTYIQTDKSKTKCHPPPLPPTSGGSIKTPHLLFDIYGNISEQFLFHCLSRQSLVHGDIKTEGLGVDVTHVHPAFVSEQQRVAATTRIDADVELLTLKNKCFLLSFVTFLMIY